MRKSGNHKHLGVRLSESAKQKLREAINEPIKSEPTTTNPTLCASINEPMKSEPVQKSNTESKSVGSKSRGRPVKNRKVEPSVNLVTNCSQPLVLATASDWVMSGSDMRTAIFDVKKEEKTLSSVRVLRPEEIGSVVRGCYGKPD